MDRGGCGAEIRIPKSEARKKPDVRNPNAWVRRGGFLLMLHFVVSRSVSPQSRLLPMDDWFSHLAAGSQLSDGNARQLHKHGFAVLPGPIGEMDRLGLAYDVAVASADAADVKTGKSSTRVVDFVNRG